jgi:hypothetical protein
MDIFRVTFGRFAAAAKLPLKLFIASSAAGMSAQSSIIMQCPEPQ